MTNTARLYKDGYPTEKSLKTIREWPMPGGYASLVDYLAPLFEEHGRLTRDGEIVTLLTFGWSGCEDVVEALRENEMFWMLCWESSHRGGMFKFTVTVTEPPR